MKYLVLLTGYGEMPVWEDLTAEQQAADAAKFEAFGAACEERDGVQILAGEALAPAEQATVLRTRGGEVTLTDGPFDEAVEHLGGFYLVEAPSADVLTDLLRLLPAYDMQISPVLEDPLP